MKETNDAHKLREGDPEALAALVATTYRMVVNVFRRLVQSETIAVQMTETLYKRVALTLHRRPASVPLPSWILEAIRDVAFESLGSEAWKQSFFVRAREVLSEPAGLSPMSDVELDEGAGWSTVLDGTFKEPLSQEHRLVLELLFVERIPGADVAELLDVSPTMLNSFVLSVFEDLARFSHLEHQDDCPSDVNLGVHILSRMDSPAALEEMEKNLPCDSCRTVSSRTRRLIEFFTVDSRYPARPAADLVAGLAESTRQRVLAAKASKARLTPPPTPLPQVSAKTPPPPPARSWARLAIPAVLAAGLGIASLPMIAPERPLAAPPVVAAVAKKETVGTYANPFRNSLPLFVGQTLQSARNHHTMVDLASGHQVMMDPGSSATFDAGSTTLVEGRFGIEAAEEGGLELATGAVKAKAGAVRGTIDRRPGHRTEYRVTAGQLALELAGTVMMVDSRRFALYDERTARIVIRDLAEDEVAAAAWTRPSGGPTGPRVAGAPRALPVSSLPPFSMRERAQATN